MTVDEFLVWAEGQEGRWGLLNGVPYTTSPDTVGHGEVKMAVNAALRRAARTASQPCHVVGSGVGIRVSDTVMYVPDASVYCGEELPDEAIEIPSPVILVEVTSPWTREMDETAKLDGYFSPADRAALPDHRSGQAAGHPLQPAGGRLDPQVRSARGQPAAVATGDRADPG
jgi:Uma2 family endonuclease